MRFATVAVSFTAMLLGQTTEKVFRFTHAETGQEYMEMATLVRSMTEIRDVSVDTSERTMTISATPKEVAFAEWIFNELDRPPPAGDTTVREYRLDGGEAPIARIFYLAAVESPESLQEIATVARSIGEIRRLLIYNGPKAIALRGSPDEVALAEWLFRELQRTAADATVKPEYQMSGVEDKTVRVFRLIRVSTPQQLQEIAAEVRQTLEIRRLFTYNSINTIVLRGTTEQIAQAERLIAELDR